MMPSEPVAPRRSTLLLGVAVALFAAALTGGQAIYAALTGEELCVGQGCALVGQLTRVSPALFNLVGCLVFLGVAVTAYIGLRRGFASTRLPLHLLLTAAFAAEGVLFPYQYFVAGAWCSYCLVILALVAALNVILLGRGALFGLGSFCAAATIFSLLSFIPFNKNLAHGTYAVQPGNGGPDLYLLFSEDCPHCREVEEQLAVLDGCTVRYNPVAPVTEPLFPSLEKNETYDPRVNLAAATFLGLRRIPILIVEEETGMQVVTGTSFILDYVQTMCGETLPGYDLFDDSWQQDSLFPPEDDGCGLEVDCD